MTALEMATEFVNTMNPERKTDGTANFGIMEFPLPQDGVHLEVCFTEEDFLDEQKYKTAIDVVGDTGEGTGIYTCIDTMTDMEAIAGGIAYVTEQASMYYDSKAEETDGERGAKIIEELLGIMKDIDIPEKGKIVSLIDDLYGCLDI